MTDYPQYPQPENKITRKGEYPKLPLDVLMRTYDEFTALGLYLVPKRSRAKFPVQRYWEKDNGELAHILTDRNEAIQWQLQDDVSGWCVVAGKRSGNLVVLDFDTAEIEKNGVDAFALYDSVQRMSPTNFVLKTPANGVHLYYRLGEEQDLLGNTKPPVNGVDQRGEGGQVVFIGGYNRYDNTPENAYADKKGVQDGHCDTYSKIDGGDYSHIPTMSEKLYTWLTMSKTTAPDKELAEANNYGQTEMGQKRMEAHFKQSLDDRERLIVECLEYVLQGWDEDKSYEQWYTLWMSAHHGSSGSQKVRDFMLTHPNVYWRDGEKGRLHFKRAWDTYVWREGGTTVSTLMWLAKRSGWLTQTGYEIPATLVEDVSYMHVSDWLDTLSEVPKRLLLMSQTGSGKTYAIRKVWAELGEPKTVVFVPSIKLATELCMTLRNEHSLPAVLYRDNETGYTLSSEELSKAHVLVTTLQTFATKVQVPMSEYGLVYVEESDQLLAQFARGGGGLYGSHVSESEARSGFRVIRDAMQNSGVMWFVDATMTMITYNVAEATRGEQTVQVVRNTKTKNKAEVRFVSSKGAAYQEVLKALEHGKKVVVAADTAQTAEELVKVMDTIGVLDERRHLLIIRRTERNPEVTQFMENVNLYASLYDLVVYNSVMASGVSITSTKPDLVVQICSYLTPRTNLQMLNRYRQQNEVIVYYRTGENLYAQRANEVLGFAQERAQIESQLINIPMATRTSDAELRAYVASISIGDNEVQERSPREFYQSLLVADGRSIIYNEGTPASDIVKHSIRGVRELQKALKEVVAQTWHTVEPIDRDRPAKAHYTDLQVVLGEAHADIEKALRGNIPNLSQISPEVVYDTVMEFKSYGFILTAYIRQEMALRKAETYMADRGRAVTTLMNNITLIKVLSTVRHLYSSLDESLTPEIMASRATKFLTELISVKDSYDAVISRKTQKFDAVYAKNEDPIKRALAFSKILLARIGLKQRAERVNRQQGEATYHYGIANIETAKQFLLWRNGEDTTFSADIEFTTAPIDAIILSRNTALEQYKTMSESEQERVMDLLEDIDFATAVNIVVTSPLDEIQGVW